MTSGTSSFNRTFCRASLILLQAVVLIPATLANPQDGHVAAGSASIDRTSASRLDLNQHSDRAVIDWRSFDINSDEHTSFQQPSSSSVALNRVRGSGSSLIDGRLTANGQVFLVNQNGVLFGKNARVDVAGLVATTADINNEEFMSGHYRFDKPSANPDAEVVNKGQIQVQDGGAVVLAAPQVSNVGIIKARLGKVALAGAKTFTLDFHGDGLLQFDAGSEVTEQSSASQSESDALVSNSGTIVADGGIVAMNARAADGVVDRVINMDGVVQARAVALEGGKIILSGGDEGIVAVSGKLDASGLETGQKGGTVKVLGEKVGLFEGAKIDASGDAGGGDVLIGGNYKGQGPEPNAKRAFVAKDAGIKADATSDGDGGKVIVWSDEVTRFRGDISAQGGSEGGDGGFVEVSSKAQLEFAGDVNTLASQGETGTLLLDPDNITIVTDIINGGGSDLDEVDEFDDLPEQDALVLADTISNAASNVVLQALNDIDFDGEISMVNARIGITAQAGNDINVNANITTQGGALHLEADSPHSPTGGGDGLGSIAFSNGASAPQVMVSTNGGDVTLIANRFLFFGSSFVEAGSGNIERASSVDGANFVFGIQENPIDIPLRTDGTSTIGQATTAGSDGRGTGALTLTAGTLSIQLARNFNASTTVLVAKNDIEISAPITGQGTLVLQPNEPGVPIDIGTDTPGFDLTQNDIANVDFDRVVIGRENGAHDIEISNATFAVPVTIRSPTGGSITVGSPGPAIPGLRGTGNASINLIGSGETTTLGAGIITDGQPIIIEDSVILDNDVALDTTGEGLVPGGEIRIDGATNGSPFSLDLIAGNGPISLGVVGNTDPLASLTASGATISLQDVTTQGAQIYTGAVTFNSSYNTNGGDFSVVGNTLLGSDSSVSSGGGGITFNGLIDSAVDEGDPAALTLNAVDGAIALLGNVGSRSALGRLTATGGSISLQDVTTQGPQTYTGAVTFNSSYNTKGGDFLVAGNASLASDTSVDTDGGIIRFERTLNGSKALRLADSGDIFFGGDVGTSNRLGPVTIDGAGNITIRGRFVAGDTSFRYSGNATSPVDSLNLTSLFLSRSAQGATLFGTVDGASGEDAALVVQGPFDDPDFTINNCVIGVACGPVVPEPLQTQAEPIPPVGLFGSTPSPTEERTLWAIYKRRAPSEDSTGKTQVSYDNIPPVYKRHPPSEDPTEPQYSNFGNEELWD